MKKIEHCCNLVQNKYKNYDEVINGYKKCEAEFFKESLQKCGYKHSWLC